MIYKTENLRKIEKLISLLPGNLGAQIAIKNELTYYIRNLKIILTCLLDSIHDFGAGPLLRGNAGYINYIINNINDQALSISGDPQNIKTYIINWISGWNSLTYPAVFINVPVHTNNHTGSIYEFITSASTDDAAENFVALLLKVDSTVVNRYDDSTSKPNAGNPIHNGAIAVVNDHKVRATQCPLFLDSLYEANQPAVGNRKFFTVRDNGFGSLIFENRDTNAVPPARSLTDTIYTGPGRWDNGDNQQYVKNALKAKQPAMRLADANLGPFNLITWNILDTMTNQNTQYDGGVLGFRYIQISDHPNHGPDVGITFGNRIFHGAGGGVVYDYETFIPFDELRTIGKTAIKRVTKTLVANVTTISLTDLREQMKPWFQCDTWNPNGPGSVAVKMKGDAVLKFALGQPGPTGIKNANMIIGALLDTKRSGDFMQSASVAALQILFQAKTNQNRTGIFATNDRIAGYISAKIHGNYTILSIKGSPFTMAAIWNAPNKTLRNRAPPRSAIRPEELSGTNKFVNVGGGNKRQKYGSNTVRNMKKKKGGVFVPQKMYDPNVEDFFALMEDMHILYGIWGNLNEIPSYDIAYKLAQNLYKLYGYINEHQELITNLFKKFFSTKITNFDKGLSKSDILSEDSEWSDNEMKMFIYGGEGGEIKNLLLEFMSLNAFKEFPNFIEELDIINVDKQHKIFLPDTGMDPHLLTLGSAASDRAFCAKIKFIDEVYRPYTRILKEIFEYQIDKTIDLIKIIHKTYPGFLPPGNDIITDYNLKTKTDELSIIIQYVSYMSEQINIESEAAWDTAWRHARGDWENMNQDADFFVPNAVPEQTWNALSNHTQQDPTLVNIKNWVAKCGGASNAFEKYEQIRDMLETYYEYIYNLEYLAKQLVDVSTTAPTDDFYVAVINGLNYYDEQSQLENEHFKENFKIIEQKAAKEAGLLEGVSYQQQQPQQQQWEPLRSSSPGSDYTDEDSEDSDDNDFERSPSPLGRQHSPTPPLSERRSIAASFARKGGSTPPPFAGVTYDGSTKSVLYLAKIEKLKELNKKLRKNKTKNKNKIEKNNKEIDELKIKIKKEKEKTKQKAKEEKEKAKEEKEKEKLKKEKQKAKKEKQKEQQREKEQKQNEQKQKAEKTKNNNTKTKKKQIS